MINPVRNLIGCRIKTHYNTGGIITNVIGPYPAGLYLRPEGSYTINIKDSPTDKSFGIINTITVKDGVVLCEGKPLEILARVADVKVSLLDLLEEGE